VTDVTPVAVGANRSPATPVAHLEAAFHASACRGVVRARASDPAWL